MVANSDNKHDEITATVKEMEKKRPVSMHEDIPVWYDCCSCEAEPYWLEAMADEEKEKPGVQAIQPDKK